ARGRREARPSTSRGGDVAGASATEDVDMGGVGGGVEVGALFEGEVDRGVRSELAREQGQVRQARAERGADGPGPEAVGAEQVIAERRLDAVAQLRGVEEVDGAGAIGGAEVEAEGVAPGEHGPGEAALAAELGVSGEDQAAEEGCRQVRRARSDPRSHGATARLLRSRRLRRCTCRRRTRARPRSTACWKPRRGTGRSLPYTSAWTRLH